MENNSDQITVSRKFLMAALSAAGMNGVRAANKASNRGDEWLANLWRDEYQLYFWLCEGTQEVPCS